MKKETKRLLKSIFATSLVAALGVGMVPVQSIAPIFDTAIVASAVEEDTIATVNGEEFAAASTLATAINAAGDDVKVVFYKDTTLSYDVRTALFNLKKHANITVDTNGKTIKTSGSLTYNNIVAEGEEAKLRTLTITGNGTLEYTGSNAFLWINDVASDDSDNYDKFEVNFDGGVTVKAVKYYAVVVNTINYDTSPATFTHQARDITFNFKNVYMLSGAGICPMGNINQVPTYGNPVTINIYEDAYLETVDGSAESGDADDYAAAIYQAGYSVVNVYGGTVKGGNGIYTKQGILNVYDGSNIIGAAEGGQYVPNGNGYKTTGDAIVIEDNVDYLIRPTVTFYGGNIESEGALSVATYKATKENGVLVPDSTPPEVQVTVTGGTFTANGEADKDSVSKYFTNDNAMLPTGEVISKEEYAENGYSVSVDETTGFAELTPDGTFIDDAHHAWYQIDNGNLTIFGDGEVATAELVFQDRKDIKYVRFTDNVKVSSLRGWFKNCTNLEFAYDLPDCDNANMLFYGCKKLEEVSNFPTVTTTCTTMFKDCASLEKIGNGSPLVITTSGTIYGMFGGCTNLSADIIFDGAAKTVDGKQNIFDEAATANGAKITVCFGENAAEDTIAWVTSDVENAGKNVNIHDYQKSSEDGTNVYTCRVCGDEYTTYDVAYNEEVKEYKEGAEVVIPAPEGAESGAWFVNGVRVDTLETAENYAVDEDNTLTITVCEPVESVEWKEFAGETMMMSSRKKSGTYTKVTLTGKWALPEGAEVIEAGIARVYAEDCPADFDAQYIYENGSKKVSTLTTRNGKYSYTLSMNSKNAKKTLCAVDFVTYTLNGVEYTDFSDIAVSAEPVLS